MKKNKYIIQLETNFDDYPIPSPDILFYDDIWATIENHADEIVAIYEFEKFLLSNWVKSLFTKRKDYPRIFSLGNFSQLTMRDKERIAGLSYEGHVDILYEVKTNKLINNLIELYKGKYTLVNNINELLEENQNLVLDEFFKQSNPESKFIFFGHDGEPIFIIFFEEEQLNDISENQYGASL